MRKISKLLIALITIFFGIGVVKADNCDNIRMTAEAGSDGSPFVRNAIKMKFGSYEEGRLLTLKDNGRELPSYCHNVSKPTGADYGTTLFSCRREIFDSTTSLTQTDIRNVFDAGLIKILATGYRVNNTSAGVVEYTATDLAVKTYELLFPSNINSNNMNSGTQKEYLKAYQAFANKMLDDKDITAKLKQAAGSVRSKYSGAISYSWVSNSDAIEKRAKELILIGLDAAINFKSNGAASLTWNSNPSVLRDAVTEDGKYNASLSYTFRLTGFTSANALANVSFSCANCQTNGVNYTISVNNEELGQNYTSAIDLLSRVTNGSGEVTVTVKFSANSKTYGCEALDYKFDIKYRDDSIANEAYEMYSTHRNCAGNACQPIYTLKNTNVTKSTAIEDSFSLCDITCEELETKCKAGNSKACQEFQKQYNSKCVNCGVGIKNNVCAEPGETSTLDLIEGYSIDPKTCTQSDKADITGCILGKDAKDQAGNSYVYMDNGVCRVSCKEDFHFNLPGNINVGSGRYFTLKTDVKATKTCYLDIYGGDPSSVLAKFEDGAKKTQEEYPACAEAKAKAALKASDFKESGTELVSCGQQPVRVPKYTYQGYSDRDECLEHFSSKECYAKQDGYTYVYQEQKASVKIYTASYSYDGGCCANCSGKGTITIKQDVEYINGTCQATGDKDSLISSKLSELKTSSDSACKTSTELTSRASVREYSVSGVGSIKAYVYSGSYTVSTGGSKESIYNGLGAYNACALWDMTYDFNPDMYFDYEEGYSNSAITHKMDLVGEISKGSTTQYYCRVNDKDNAYESCSSGWQNEPIFGSKSVCVCDADKCENQSIAFNNTRRMKKSVSYTASYITPTQFYQIYPTGEVVASKSGEGIENGKELTNGLPVGLGTPQGKYHYALYAKNLGEYFGTSKFGRVWGNSKSVVATTLKSQEKCITEGALRYDTNIEDRYIDKGVWVCDYCVDENCDGGGNTCTKLDGSTVDMTNCLKENDNNKSYCESQLCPKVCIHKTYNTPIDMTSCIKDGKTAAECEKELCCPECDPGFVCAKVYDIDRNVTVYYGPTGEILTGKGYDSIDKELDTKCSCTVEISATKTTYYGPTGKILTKAEYDRLCCPTCDPNITLFINGVSFRQIALNNLNPNGRKLGKNWTGGESTALELKAKLTTDEILTDGETIYDENSYKYVMKVTLDSAMINSIKSRGEKNYATNTLSCYDYTEGGTTYKNIFCYSKYIDELVTKHKDKIKFGVERPFTEEERKKSQYSEYWTTWTKKLANSKWSVNTTMYLSYNNNIGIGPSWK